MKRREMIKGAGILAAATALHSNTFAIGPGSKGKGKRLLRLAHITDVHMRPDLNAPNRFRQCMEEIKKHKVDFFLNGGDTIFAADYADITRERMLEQWSVWHSLRNAFDGYEMHSCLGNHDMWWAAPSKDDPMYGKEYVVKQLGISHRYYSFSRKGWHFILLDSNNDHAGSLDTEQRKWLDNELAGLSKGTPVLCMSHYPIMGVSTLIEGGNHTDARYITELFYRHKDKQITCLSGHMHLLDHAEYNGVQYFCNGALSGFWWGEGDKDSAGRNYYKQTPPGYAIVDLFADGRVENTYYPHLH